MEFFIDNYAKFVLVSEHCGRACHVAHARPKSGQLVTAPLLIILQ